MIRGSYYLTYSREEEGTGHIFADKDEALLAYDAKIVTLHSPIKVRLYREEMCIRDRECTSLVNLGSGWRTWCL